METTFHAFFETLDAWKAVRLPCRVYGMAYTHSELADKKYGVRLIHYQIQLTQIEHYVAHHLVLEIGQANSLDQEHQKQCEQRLDHAWQAMKHWIEKNDMALATAKIGIPDKIMPLITFLPKGFIEEYAPATT